MAQTQRAEAFHNDLRNTLSRFLDDWEHLQALRTNFDALGGQGFFTDFFAIPREITQAELYAAVVSINNLETAMNLGPKGDFYKVQG